MAPNQSQLRAALLDPAQPSPAGLTDGQGKPTQKRFDVYRNNVTVALSDALRASFPVLRKLLGDENFDQLAPLFARSHPPSSPLMMYYGDAMPTFLKGFAPLAHIGYLSDIARLELGLRRAYHAADSEPLDPAVLESLAPEALQASTLTFAPAVQLITSDWPLFDIWRYNMVDGAPKPQAVAQSVLITRAAFDPSPHPLDPAQAAWITAIQGGKTIDAAHDAALAIAADFDLSPLLTVLLQNGALIRMTTPKD
ncbi:HvfC/BufC N-terminal domain-containing protein [Tateyamaria pelophila]|uniref:HvfC/BufC N-terminal domain-containing protein n=1 Tax=Tateyamaria pelophila TaxID=328415 RepID=UPI001CBC279D|nr:DNA-binding domain-containing protein [Tateyamaria pelophila]